MALIKLNNQSLTAVTALPAAIPTGKIGQVIWAEMDVGVNIASGTFVDLTGGAETLEATITPSATSSKIWITYTIQASMNSNRGFTSQINRNNSAIYGPSNQKDTYGDGDSHQQRSTITYLDSPSSTSALTYKIKVKTDGSATVTFANGNSACMITLMEVLA